MRFELTKGCPLPVFKTGAIDHSATLPVESAGSAFGGGAYDNTLQSVTRGLATCGNLAQS